MIPVSEVLLVSETTTLATSLLPVKPDVLSKEKIVLL